MGHNVYDMKFFLAYDTKKKTQSSYHVITWFEIMITFKDKT
jgi:hypothetical protein